MACSLGCLFGLEPEALDISTAFLQGLKFTELSARAKELGYDARQIREVYFRPPANLWISGRTLAQPFV